MSAGSRAQSRLRWQNRVIYTGLGACVGTQYVWFPPVYLTLAGVAIVCTVVTLVWKAVE